MTPHIRFHDLRHTAATLLFREKVHPKVVQERLGHARIQITLDTYSHTIPSMQRAAAKRLDRMFAKLDVGVWLQLGYKRAAEAPEDDSADDANTLELQENEEWSHLDSNQGPPACEEDQGQVRHVRRSPTSSISWGFRRNADSADVRHFSSLSDPLATVWLHNA